MASQQQRLQLEHANTTWRHARQISLVFPSCLACRLAASCRAPKGGTHIECKVQQPYFWFQQADKAKSAITLHHILYRSSAQELSLSLWQPGPWTPLVQHHATSQQDHRETRKAFPMPQRCKHCRLGDISTGLQSDGMDDELAEGMPLLALKLPCACRLCAAPCSPWARCHRPLQRRQAWLQPGAASLAPSRP